jgi:hypothetical protein
MRFASVVAALCLVIAGVMVFVANQVDDATERFKSSGIHTVATIVEFREVSSGRQPRRRTVAIAKVNGETMTSHILMGEGDVAALKPGQVLTVLVVSADQLPETLLEGKFWFITQSTLDRHLRNPARQWAWPAAGAFLGSGCLFGIYAWRKTKYKRKSLD